MKRITGIETPSLKGLYTSTGLVFFLYFYIFQPPLFPFAKGIYLGIELIIFLVYVVFDKFFFVSFVKLFKIEIRILVVIALYTLLRDLLGQGIVYSDRFAAWAFQGFFFSYLIIYHISNKRKIKRKNKSIFVLIYWTCFLAAVLTVLLLTNKSFDSFYESIADSAYYEYYKNFDLRYRAYGISENLTFTYSYVLGLFCGYSLLLLRKNILFIVPFGFFLLGVIYNARIGFLAIVFFLIYALFRFREWFSLKTLFLLGSVLFVVFYFFSDLLNVFTLNKEWVLSAFYAVSDFLFATNYLSGGNVLSTLTSDFIILPDSYLHWIFGDGKSISTDEENNSDVGYILQLNYGGLFLLLLLFILILHISKRLYKALGVNHWYVFFFVGSILFLNFKGFVFAATPGGRLLFFLYVYYIFISNKQLIFVQKY